MKLSVDTLSVLKNFATVNSGIFIRKGKMLATISSAKHILAEAVVEEDFEKDFGIYDLNNFLSVISMYKEGAELAFDEKHVIIKSVGGRSRVKYRFTDPSMIVVADDKRPKLPSIDVSIDLKQSDFEGIMKAAQVMGSPNIMFESKGKEVSLVAFDLNNDAAHTTSITLDDKDVVRVMDNFKVVFKTENLKMIPGSYKIGICSKGVSMFVNEARQLKYWIALETQSKFED